MPYYGSNTLPYGSTDTTYGEVPALEFGLAWALEIDWDGDGLFDGINEAVRMTGLTVSRGRRNMLSSQGSGFASPQTGRAVATLDNYDQKYNAWNTSSPLYPNVRPGKIANLRVLNRETGETHPVLRGVVTDIVPDGYGDDAKVTIYIDDGWAYLRETRNRTYYAQAGTKTVSSAIDDILDSVNWPYARSIESSTDIIPLFHVDDGASPGAEIQAMADAWIGTFFIAVDGTAIYRRRQTIPASVIDYTQTIMLKDISMGQPWQNERNVVRFHVRTWRDLGKRGLVDITNLEIGELDAISAGATNNVWTNYTYETGGVTYENVFARGVVFKSTTDGYEFNSNASGTGTDLTSQVKGSLYHFGNRAKISLKNSAGVTAYPIALKLQGLVFVPLTSQDVEYPDNIFSVELPKEFYLDTKYIGISDAQKNVDTLGAFLSGSFEAPIIRLRGRYDEQFTPDLFDTVTLALSELGFSQTTFRVGGIDHQSSRDNCQDILTTLYLEPILPST